MLLGKSSGNILCRKIFGGGLANAAILFNVYVPTKSSKQLRAAVLRELDKCFLDRDLPLTPLDLESTEGEKSSTYHRHCKVLLSTILSRGRHMPMLPKAFNL